MVTVGKCLVIFAAIAASTLYVASGASVSHPHPPGHNKDVHHCGNSFGVDYNDLLGITEQFLRMLGTSVRASHGSRS